eukprot:COSAG01_NODE_2148_length_8299_cov_283.948177_9_plen_123_part_00
MWSIREEDDALFGNLSDMSFEPEASPAEMVGEAKGELTENRVAKLKASSSAVQCEGKAKPIELSNRSPGRPHADVSTLTADVETLVNLGVAQGSRRRQLWDKTKPLFDRCGNSGSNAQRRNE